MFTVLYDNYEGREELQTAWGFSCLVTGTPQTILFDTGGDGEILLRNMDCLGVEPGAVDTLVLSHEHWDHTGGLMDFLAENPAVKVYLPGVFSEAMKDEIKGTGAELVETREATRLCPGVLTTPVLGGPTPEQALCVRTVEGPVVLTGCAHPGIAELVEAAGQACGESVRAAMGGFHLKDAWGTEVNATIARLKELGVQQAGPSHCSGEETRKKMAEAFGDDYIDLAVGVRVDMEPAR